MSQENVDLVLRLYPAREVDVARLFRGDQAWATFAEARGHLFHPNFVTSSTNPINGRTETYVGLDGLRTFWLDWLAPWATYRTEVEEAIDCGDRVLAYIDNFGRLDADEEKEIKLVSAAVWTVRDGRIARVDGYPVPAEALKAVGLEG